MRGFTTWFVNQTAGLLIWIPVDVYGLLVRLPSRRGIY
jgi:hypothetical protein